jgi:hypothetical protein
MANQITLMFRWELTCAVYLSLRQHGPFFHLALWAFSTPKPLLAFAKAYNASYSAAVSN